MNVRIGALAGGPLHTNCYTADCDFLLANTPRYSEAKLGRMRRVSAKYAPLEGAWQARTCGIDLGQRF